MNWKPSAFAILILFLVSGARSGDVHISAYYYPWYDNNGLHWDEGYAKTGPLLGTYSSRSPLIINEHLDWSEQFGIDSWICAWWGPKSWEDTTLRTAVMPLLENRIEKKANSTQICLLYESAGLLGLSEAEGIRFSPGRIAKFVSDFEFLANRYFSHPAYLTIEGRPVVYLYLSRAFTGNYEEAISRAREICKRNGYDVYLVGDEVYWGEADRKRISQFDAITAYNMHGPEEFASLTDWTEFVKECESVYKKFRTLAEEQNISFFPGIIPGFDASGTGPNNPYYTIPRKIRNDQTELSTLRAMSKMAKRTLDSKVKHVAVTSFNEWHEGTQLEPSSDETSRAEFQETMEIFSSLKK